MSQKKNKKPRESHNGLKCIGCDNQYRSNLDRWIKGVHKLDNKVYECSINKSISTQR